MAPEVEQRQGETPEPDLRVDQTLAGHTPLTHGQTSSNLPGGPLFPPSGSTVPCVPRAPPWEEDWRMLRTRKDRNTVLALTAKDRTAATVHTRRSDFKTSFCEEKTSRQVHASLSNSVSPGKSGDRVRTLDKLCAQSITHLIYLFPLAQPGWTLHHL